MTDRIADLDEAVELDAAAALEGSTVESADPAESDGTDPTGTDPTGTDPTGTAAAMSRRARRQERRRHRVSKWDRPPEPKDWRFFVGTLGKVLIATGILMFGFVAYQLWGTGIETARAQNRLESAFAAAIADGATVDGTTVDGTSTDTIPSTDTTPVTSEPIDELTPEPEPAPDPEPSLIVPGAVDLSDTAIEQEIPPIERGDVIARLEIPKIHDDPLYVVAGVTLDDLKQGPGHYPDTPLPGQLGNAAIAGHRTTYGAPFFDVDQLVAGDQLVVTTIAGGRFVYEVTGVRVVSAADYWVVTTRDPNVAELTLTSCHPKYTARDRIVVHSVLVPELSSPVGVADLYELDDAAGDGAPIPGDDPTIVDDPAEPDDPAELPTTPDGDDSAESVNSAESDDVAGPIDETGDGGSSGVASPAEPDAPLQIDAFSQGWFDDDEAWPQIALWGFVLTLISLLAYQVSKRTRHDSIGLLVGIAPFLVALYFFFQNVNRLLPPGL